MDGQSVHWDSAAHEDPRALTKRLPPGRAAGWYRCGAQEEEGAEAQGDGGHDDDGGGRTSATAAAHGYSPEQGAGSKDRRSALLRLVEKVNTRSEERLDELIDQTER